MSFLRVCCNRFIAVIADRNIAYNYKNFGNLKQRYRNTTAKEVTKNISKTALFTLAYYYAFKIANNAYYSYINNAYYSYITSTGTKEGDLLEAKMSTILRTARIAENCIAQTTVDLLAAKMSINPPKLVITVAGEACIHKEDSEDPILYLSRKHIRNKFVIAHELAHKKNNDHERLGNFKKITVLIGSFIFATETVCKLRNTPLLGVGRVAVLCSLYFSNKLFSRRIEKNADITATQYLSTTDILKGIEALSENKRKSINQKVIESIVSDHPTFQAREKHLRAIIERRLATNC